MIALYAIVSTVIISLVSLVGIITLTLKKHSIHEIVSILVSLAVGAFLGDVFFHILPESYATIGQGLLVPILVLGGLVAFLFLEKIIRWRHCHHETSQTHTHPLVTMNLVGDGVHNLLDGIAVAASYLISIPVGVATSLAVLLHEIPQEISDFGVLVHGGLSVKKALWLNLLSATTAIIGTIVTLIVGPSLTNLTPYLLPIIAGGFLYIATSDLIPALHEKACDQSLKDSMGQIVAIIFGIAIMALLLTIG